MEKIEEFTRGISFDQLMADERTKDAILRNLQVIGELSKNPAGSSPVSPLWGSTLRKTCRNP
ncbi:HepT-like ribonuclease domain-containing protein [Methanoregula sp.]|uniref:HepT-like ribonuclease domain-containing protein n=1 Tax=Methanoregula sp. TaxID=2052170 RepID=UPI003D0C2159